VSAGERFFAEATGSHGPPLLNAEDRSEPSREQPSTFGREPRRKPPRIFIGLVETAGYFNNLAQALVQCGAEVTQVDAYGNPFDFPRQAASARIVRLITWLGKRRSSSEAGGARLSRLWWQALHRLAMPLLLVWAAARHDVFIYAWRSSFMRFRELPVLKLLGKRLVFVFLGSDIRPAYMSGSDVLAAGSTIEPCLRATRRKRRELERVERRADLIVSHPPLSQLLRRPFVSFLAVGFVSPLRDRSPSGARNGPVRILHSPSLPEVKGTPRIREAIERLKTEGLELEYVEVIRQPNAVVLDELARCDFVVDQLYSDTPLAGFATEAASLGKAAIVGSYDWDEILRDLPREQIPPSHRCHPDEIADAIRQLVRDPDYRTDLGSRAHEFVRERWNPAAVGGRFLRLIQGDAPPDWLCDPRAIRYVHGVGLDDERLREVVRRVVQHAGPEALLLDDKPELLRKLLSEAGLPDAAAARAR